MSDRLSVGKTYANPWFGLAVFAALIGLPLGLVLLACGGQAGGTIALVAGVLGLAITLVMAQSIAAGKLFVTLQRSGFVLENRSGEYPFTDNAITDLGTWSEIRYFNGHPRKIRRSITMRLDAGDFAEPIAFSYDSDINASDPFEEFVGRNLERLVRVADGELKRGGQLTGEHWTLTSAELTFDDNHGEIALPWGRLSAVDIVDKSVCVWERGAPQPKFKVDVGSRNALILARLLGTYLDRNPAPDERTDNGLGRIIFERDHSWPVAGIAFCVLCILGCFLAALYGLYASVAERGIKNPWVMILIGLSVGPLIAILMYQNLKKIFRCHQAGVSLQSVSGEQQMRYEDVKAFTYSVTRMYVNGGYTGTEMVLEFEDGEDRRLRFQANVKNADAEFDNLRDHISRVIAAAMSKKLAAGRSVTWTDHVDFTPGGLEVDRQSRAGGKVVPYQSIRDFTMNAGTFGVLVHGQEKPIFECMTKDKNFFPGFMLLTILISQGPGTPASQPESAEPEVDFDEMPPRPSVPLASGNAEPTEDLPIVEAYYVEDEKEHRK